MHVNLDPELWVRHFGDRPAAGVRLVCFPHAGGSASYFRPLFGVLAEDIDPVALQYPGRQDRRGEPVAGSVGELADAIVAVLGTGLLEHPTVFFGHSMGATVAFEVVRRYEREHGAAPLGLIASGRRAPSIARTEILHTAPDALMLREMRLLKGTDAQLLGDPEIRAMILPVIRADYRVIETYQWTDGPPLGVPIHMFTGDADPGVSVEDARAWERHTAAGFRLHTFPGGHFYLGELPWATVAAEVERSVRAFAATAPVGQG
jgi:surfactin synthase thioesterase subunit